MPFSSNNKRKDPLPRTYWPYLGTSRPCTAAQLKKRSQQRLSSAYCAVTVSSSCCSFGPWTLVRSERPLKRLQRLSTEDDDSEAADDWIPTRGSKRQPSGISPK